VRPALADESDTGEAGGEQARQGGFDRARLLVAVPHHCFTEIGEGEFP